MAVRAFFAVAQNLVQLESGQTIQDCHNRLDSILAKLVIPTLLIHDVSSL
jgi:hypothetical protein